MSAHSAALAVLDAWEAQDFRELPSSPLGLRLITVGVAMREILALHEPVGLYRGLEVCTACGCDVICDTVAPIYAALGVTE